MSTEMMTAVWKHSRAKGSALLLLLAIADNSNDDGLAWPGIENLAQRSRLGKRAVIKQLEKLEGMGELIIYRRPGAHNHYILNVQLPDESLNAAIYALATKLRLPVETLKSELASLVNRSSPVAETTLVNQSSPPGEPEITSTGEPGFTRSITGTINDPPEDDETRVRANEMQTVMESALDTAGEKPPDGDGMPGSGDAAFADVSKAYEANIGGLTPMIRDTLVDAVEQYPADWILDAIRIAVEREARHWAYVEAVLKNWRKRGRGSLPPQKRGKKAPSAQAQGKDQGRNGGSHANTRPSDPRTDRPAQPRRLRDARRVRRQGEAWDDYVARLAAQGLEPEAIWTRG